MAQRIPIIEQTVGATMGPDGPRAQGSQYTSPYAAAANTAAGAFGELARADLYRQKQEEEALARQQEEDAKSYAGKAVASATVEWDQALQDRKLQAGPGAHGFTPGVLKDFDEYATKTVEQAPTPTARKYVDQHLTSLRTQLAGQAIAFEGQAKVNLRIDNHQKSAEEWGKIIASNPTEDKIQMARNALAQTLPDVGPEARQKLQEHADSVIRNSAWASLVERDPARAKAVIDQVFGKVPGGTEAVKSLTTVPGAAQPATSFDQTMAFILKQEGGYSATDGNTGKPVNFGINQKANPDIDVKSLTKEKALEIYKERYWDAIGADKLPPAAALMAMDAAVNQGPEFAKKLIKQTGGDPDQMAAMRRAQYESITKADPTLNRYKGTWLNRVDLALNTAKAQAGATPTPPPVPAQPLDTARPPDGFSGVVGMTPMNELLHWQNQAEQKLGKMEQGQQSQLRLETQNMEALVQQGVAPTGQQRPLSDFLAAFKDPVQAQTEYARYSTARATASQISLMHGQTNDALVGVVNAPPPDPSSPNFAVEAHNLDIKQRAAAAIVQARKKDPWAYAISQGQFGAKPLDPNAETFGADLQARAAALPGLQQQYGATQAILSAPEQAMLTQRLDVLPAAQRVAMLKQIRANVGDGAVYGNLMQSIRPDSPVTAMAGSVAALGGGITVGDEYLSKDTVAQRIAFGEDLLNKSKQGKATDGNRGGFPMPKEADMRLEWSGAVGSVYAGFPEAEAHAYEAFRAYYAAQASAKGLSDPSQGVDAGIAKQAIQAATGGITKWGSWGSRKALILPYGMPEDQFKDVVARQWATLAEENGKTTPVSDIGLAPAGVDGKYIVMSGTSYMPDKTGRPMFIQVNNGAGAGQGTRATSKPPPPRGFYGTQ